MIHFRPDPKPEKTPKKQPKYLRRTAIKKKAQPFTSNQNMTLPEAKAYADKWFSQCIRLKDSDSDGFVKCFTCRENGFYSTMECGHFLGRSFINTRYDERNARPQEVICNHDQNSSGKRDFFAAGLIRIYGEGIIDTLNTLARDKQKLDRQQIIEIGDNYKFKVLQLKKEKGIK